MTNPLYFVILIIYRTINKKMDQEGNNFEKKQHIWPYSVTSNTGYVKTIKHIAFRDCEKA